MNSSVLLGASARLATLKSILKEIKPNQVPKLRSHILQEYRRHQTSDKIHCKASEEMQHLAETYAAYLVSQRQWKIVHAEYHGVGDRSVEETARMVGFKLPHDPK